MSRACTICRAVHFLPVAHESTEFFRRGFGSREEMHVVWHDDISADRPTMKSPRVAQRRDNDCCAIHLVQNSPTVRCATGDEVKRIGRKNMSQPFEVLAIGWRCRAGSP